jgi:hypothetical protein
MDEKKLSVTPESNPEIITLKSGEKVVKKDGVYYIADDIMISDEQLRTLEETGSIFTNPKEIEANKPEEFIPLDPTTGMLEYYGTANTKAVGIHPYQNMFWSMCRYSLKNIYSTEGRDSIKSAINYIESLTNVRFYDATNEPAVDPVYGFVYPCVVFKSGTSNVSNSFIGRIGGPQDLVLSPFVLSPFIEGTDYPRSIIVHEILHALGMYHEQSRWDRDYYINVIYSNIEDGISNTNYRKETSNYYSVGSFDFNSIMLYASKGQGAINDTLPTMTKKNGDEWEAKLYLSENDRKFLNTFYLPYMARTDVCIELDDVVYDSNNNILTETKRIELEMQLNINRCSYPLSN